MTTTHAGTLSTASTLPAPRPRVSIADAFAELEARAVDLAIGKLNAESYCGQLREELDAANARIAELEQELAALREVVS